MEVLLRERINNEELRGCQLTSVVIRYLKKRKKKAELGTVYAYQVTDERNEFWSGAQEIWKGRWVFHQKDGRMESLLQEGRNEDEKLGPGVIGNCVVTCAKSPSKVHLGEWSFIFHSSLEFLHFGSSLLTRFQAFFRSYNHLEFFYSYATIVDHVSLPYGIAGKTNELKFSADLDSWVDYKIPLTSLNFIRPAIRLFEIFAARLFRISAYFPVSIAFCFFCGLITWRYRCRVQSYWPHELGFWSVNFQANFPSFLFKFFHFSLDVDGVLSKKNDVIGKSEAGRLLTVRFYSFIPVQLLYYHLGAGREKFWRDYVSLFDSFTDWDFDGRLEKGDSCKIAFVHLFQKLDVIPSNALLVKRLRYCVNFCAAKNCLENDKSHAQWKFAFSQSFHCLGLKKKVVLNPSRSSAYRLNCCASKVIVIVIVRYNFSKHQWLR